MRFEFLANAAFVMVILLNSIVFGGGVVMSCDAAKQNRSVVWVLCALCFFALFCLNVWMAFDLRNLLLVP